MYEQNVPAIMLKERNYVEKHRSHKDEQQYQLNKPISFVGRVHIFSPTNKAAKIIRCYHTTPFFKIEFDTYYKEASIPAFFF